MNISRSEYFQCAAVDEQTLSYHRLVASPQTALNQITKKGNENVKRKSAAKKHIHQSHRSKSKSK